MYGWKKNDLERIDMNWVGRNGAAIPLNTTYDRTDCTAGCVVTAGTYANAQWFLEYRPFIETVKFWGVNPGIDWEVGNDLKLNLQANYTESRFHRESPSVVLLTPGSSGVTVNYTNDGGVPEIGTNIDLNNPANFGWPGGRVNIQDERRKTKTKGVRGDVTWGDSDLNIKAGAPMTTSSAASTPMTTARRAECGLRQPAERVRAGPNGQPPCNGLSQPGAAPAGYPSYPLMAPASPPA